MFPRTSALRLRPSATSMAFIVAISGSSPRWWQRCASLWADASPCTSRHWAVTIPDLADHWAPPLARGQMPPAIATPLSLLRRYAPRNDRDLARLASGESIIWAAAIIRCHPKIGTERVAPGSDRSRRTPRAIPRAGAQRAVDSNPHYASRVPNRDSIQGRPSCRLPRKLPPPPRRAPPPPRRPQPIVCVDFPSNCYDHRGRRPIGLAGAAPAVYNPHSSLIQACEERLRHGA